MRLLIKGGTIVTDAEQKKADIIIVNDRIEKIMIKGVSNTDADSFISIHESEYDKVVDASGCLVLPGIIDSHVHFREPGLTHKADMQTESRAAIYGGVTSVFDMPNTKPQTTTLKTLKEKEEMAKGRMHVNYAFFPGATNDNIEELKQLDIHTVPGIKLFMGSSTGNMLVDKEDALDGIFVAAKEMGLPLMAHCEDTDIINANLQKCKENSNTEDPDVKFHPYIRSEEACFKSSELALKLAMRHGTNLHIAHISTAKELDLLLHAAAFGKWQENIGLPQVTGEATVAHLIFSLEDYEKKGALIKCNPAIKTIADRDELRKSLDDNYHYGKIRTIGTDHAPHAIEEKKGGASKAMSGMPSIQFSLIAMLSLVDEGVISVEQLVRLMCHNPAKLFAVNERGFIREGYKADIVIVKREEKPWEVTSDCIQSKCGWSPFEGMLFNWRVMQTILNGNVVYDNGVFDDQITGEHLSFR